MAKASEILTIESATEYAQRVAAVATVSAIMGEVAGIAVVYVTLANDQGVMDVWIENGRIYGEW